MISDMERPIIDGSRHPAFVGGITEVAKGICMQRHILKIDRLLGYG
jgi:predicted transcriptional regulator of viral defense system